jgi:hypothetical protein
LEFFDGDDFYRFWRDGMGAGGMFLPAPRLG